MTGLPAVGRTLWRYMRGDDLREADDGAIAANVALAAPAAADGTERTATGSVEAAPKEHGAHVADKE